MIAGGLLILAGGLVLLLGKAGINLGHLPGDVHIQGERSSFHFPIVTCILVSVLLTVLFNGVARWWR